MENLEIHTLICSRDIEWFEKTYKLFNHYTNLENSIVVHEDGSFTQDDRNRLYDKFNNIEIIDKERSDVEILEFLKDYELCTHFRQSSHHTIFRIKLFDIFYYTKNNNVLYLDSDILFCKEPTFMLDCFKTKTGFYLRDSWSSYCVPFRDEDNNTIVDRFINAGLNYYPTKNSFNLDDIERSLEIMYTHGSRGATHPFLEQSCIAYMITKLRRRGISFVELPHPDYCVPTLNGFISDHGLTALHLNSSPLVGTWKKNHYDHELSKINS